MRVLILMLLCGCASIDEQAIPYCDQVTVSKSAGAARWVECEIR